MKTISMVTSPSFEMSIPSGGKRASDTEPLDEDLRVLRTNEGEQHSHGI
jgi:hypothetical protein